MTIAVPQHKYYKLAEGIPLPQVYNYATKMAEAWFCFKIRS
jgi:hypothetical protein